MHSYRIHFKPLPDGQIVLPGLVFEAVDKFWRPIDEMELSEKARFLQGDHPRPNLGYLKETNILNNQKIIDRNARV